MTSDAHLSNASAGKNKAATVGLALGMIVAIGAVFLFLIYFGGATIDGPQDGSVLNTLGGVGVWLEAIGILLIRPVLPFIALAEVIAGSVGYTRSKNADTAERQLLASTSVSSEPLPISSC